MASIQDDAVVLARLDYSETSQIVVLLTRGHGKVRAIAKGIKRGTKKRHAPAIDLLEVGTVGLSTRHERAERLATLTNWKQTRSLSGLREQLFRLHAGLYAAEITGRLTEDWDPHPALLDALLATLRDLCEACEPLRATVRYQMLLLNTVGLLPRFDACVRCERDADLTHFSSHEGGVICRDCEAGQIEKRGLSTPTRDLCRCGPAHPDLATFCPNESNPNQGGAVAGDPVAGAFVTFNYHIAHILGREPRLGAKLVPKDRQRTLR